MRESPWKHFGGANWGYVLEQYERYQAEPGTVDETLRALFEQYGAPVEEAEDAPAGTVMAGTRADAGHGVPSTGQIPCVSESPAVLRDAVAAERLAQYIRNYGHLGARIDPLEVNGRPQEVLNLAAFELTKEQLQSLPAQVIWPHENFGITDAYEAIVKLKQLYTRTLSFQFSHVHNQQERTWLMRMVETGDAYRPVSDEDRRKLLKRLVEVEDFEKFLHRTFLGQKRFSIEGLDMLVPMVDSLVQESVYDGAKHVMIGMAHRGRLNMLAHVLGKPYQKIFSEFQHAPNKEMVPSEGSMGINYGWTGDVKYHLGGERDLDAASYHAHLRLANNPSHLEFVNPVVEGYTRAAQEDRRRPGAPVQNTALAFAILIHGDAAFPGEGVVAETLNLSRLSGYHTGGTIHIIANNQIGFTTESGDSRSTRYASDLAKGFEIPVVHVNADDPEACLAAVHLAYQYRRRFNKDFLIDLVGYRRYGHNEADDPSATQPKVYELVNRHPSVRTRYAEALTRERIIDAEYAKQLEAEVQQKLHTAYEEIKAGEAGAAKAGKTNVPAGTELDGGSPAVPSPTPVSLEVLRGLNEELLRKPEHFHMYPKLDKILERRHGALDGDGKVDWALAETLAFASILREGTPIRLTGQDTERGTFAHRHLVWHDVEGGKSHTPLQSFRQAAASFAVYNSPLSEAAPMGFEYGFDVYAQKTLVIWEAQFGDFANAAQVMIDQFLLSGLAKWRQRSGLVLLLPHGYEGQGPEHSSARLERFLQLAAEGDCVIANPTTAAQYFHLLRLHAARLGTDAVRPLIVMAPKSLLRNPHTASAGVELSEGSFQSVLELPSVTAESEAVSMDPGQVTEHGLVLAKSGRKPVERLVLCSGKIAIDMLEELEKKDPARPLDQESMRVLRLEQLYPFPAGNLSHVIASCPRLQEIVWVQEEPRNMGAWWYIEPKLQDLLPSGARLTYIGRPERSSPAGGFPNAHKREQDRIVKAALYGEHHV
jgi:2-oxoglutarate dehydrogenase E1 component